ncbi:hypothetical protein KAJ27_20910 [bacterium]|nr:hypothetical protein [bacterium]
MKKILIIFAFSLIFTFSFSFINALSGVSIHPPDEKKKAFCEMLLGNIFDDIDNLKSKYPELSEINRGKCIKGIKFLYYYKAEYSRRDGRKKGGWKLGESGCVINIRFYFGGFNWNTLKFEGNISSIFSLLSKIDTNIQAKIISKNTKLRDEIENLIRERIKDLM